MDEASILVKDYIGLELKNFTITQITKMWKKDSYFASTRLYLVETTIFPKVERKYTGNRK
jgi:hypothetical protein